MRTDRLKRVLLSAVFVLAGAVGVFAQDAEEKTYPDGPDGLKQLWMDILEKAKAGDEDGVKKILEKTVMTEEDFTALFGDEKGKKIAAAYKEKYASHWPNEAKDIVAKVKERGYDDVEVEPATGPLGKADKGQQQFSVRVKKAGEKTGLRYDGFFFVGERWKTGLKLQRLILGDKKRPKKGGEAPPKEDDPAKPGEGGGE